LPDFAWLSVVRDGVALITEFSVVAVQDSSLLFR
jgi:hypothetical protein